MPRQTIVTPDAPSSPAWSQAVRAGHHVYVSGIVGIDPATGALAGAGVQAQTRQALTNCQAILNAAGATLDDVIEVCTLLTDPADFDAMNAEYITWFPHDPPARFTPKLGVDLPGLRISIRMVAYTA